MFVKSVFARRVPSLVVTARFAVAGVSRWTVTTLAPGTGAVKPSIASIAAAKRCAVTSLLVCGRKSPTGQRRQSVRRAVSKFKDQRSAHCNICIVSDGDGEGLI